MRGVAGRYGWVLLAVALVCLPLETFPTRATAHPRSPFLDRVSAEVRIVQALSAVGIATPVSKPAQAPAPNPVAAAAQKPVPAPTESADTEAAKRAPLTVTIREGQSLWSLAAEYGTTVDEIVAANGFTNARAIRAGTSVIIPGATADKKAAKRASAKIKPGTKFVVVRVYNGQTVWDVAQAYDVSVEDIVAANGLGSPDFVRSGQSLKVPVEAGLSPRRVATKIADSAGSAASSAVALAQGFIWPARGRLSSGFGWRRLRHHDGIDIASPYGAPITAARDGTVIFAGWYYAYGKTVILNHGNGLQTIYGHASRILVERGDDVKKGQLIAHVGSTGRSTGPHLHFEVRIKGRAVNPMKYL